MALEKLHSVLREHSPLATAARMAPAQLVDLLAEAIAAATLDELRAAGGIRRDMVWALEHLCHRKVPFEPVEASLCRLGRAEVEDYGNNATNIWTALFLVHLNPTHHAIDVRLRCLRARLDDPDTSLFALKGVETVASRETTGLGYSEEDKADGDWLSTPPKEAFDAKRTGWNWLAEFSASNDRLVAAEARRLMTVLLRESLFIGLGHHAIPLLLDRVSGWKAAERAKVRDALDTIARFDGDELQKHDALWRSFETLRNEASAATFEDRLRDVACRYSVTDANAPGGEENERRVAVEGLEKGAPVLEQLELLTSREAVRAVPFVRVLGSLDDQWVVLEPLLRRVLEAPTDVGADVLGSYVAGLGTGKRAAQVDDLLADWSGDEKLQPIVVQAVWRSEPNTRRVGVLVEILSQANSDPVFWSASLLPMGPWCGQLEPGAFCTLVDTLRRHEREEMQLVALELMARLLRYEEVEVPVDWKADVVGELVEATARRQIPNRTVHSWQQAGKWLIDQSRWGEVTRAVSLGVRSNDYGTSRAAWGVFQKAVVVDGRMAWEALRSALDESLAEGKPYLVRWEEPVLEQLPVDPIIEWIGGDEQRAETVARGAMVHGAELSPLARYLVGRFGEDGAPASVLMGRAHSTIEAVTSLAAFAQSQQRNAGAWAAAEAEPSVKVWAQRLAEQFGRDAERFRADEARDEGGEPEDDRLVGNLGSDAAEIRRAAMERLADQVERGAQLSAPLRVALDSAALNRARETTERARAIAVSRMSGAGAEMKRSLLDEWFGTDFDPEMARPIATLFYDTPSDLDELLTRLEAAEVPTESTSPQAESLSWALAAVQAQLKLQPIEVGEERARRCVEVADRFAANERLKNLVREIQLLTRGKSDIELNH